MPIPQRVEKASVSPPKVDKDAYNAVVASTAMVDIRLVASEFSVKPEFYDDEKKEKFKFSSNRGVGEVVIDQPSGFFYIPVKFAVVVKSGNSKVLTCTSEYLVVFQSSEEVDETAAKLFAAKFGVHAAYPYFRQFIASQSWASGAELPILPILKQGAVKKRSNQ